MSETLPKDAPVNEPAAPSVEDPAPVHEGEVAEESVDSSEDVKTVPADRFNGLMGRFNRTQAELDAERERVAELEARLNERTESKVEANPDVAETDNSALEQRVHELSQMLISERMESARDRAIKEYPEAAPFADLIVADTPDEVREMTRLIAERARAAIPASTSTEAGGESQGESTDSTGEASTTTQPEGSSETEGADAGSTEPPVVGGGAAYSGEASADDRVSQAIESGNFSDFLKAKWEKQALNSNGNLPVS